MHHYRLNNKAFYILLFLVFSGFLKATAFVEPDTTHAPKVLKGKKTNSLIVPAAMISFGALGLESNLIKNINRGIRHEMMQGNQGSNSRIEDGLRYLPAASTFLLHTLGVKGKNNMLDKVCLFAISTVVMDKTVDRLKSKTNQLRPDGSNYRSFPSSHTAAAFAAAEFMRKEYKDSPWLVAGAYTAATATGALRIYHNSHWLTDVVTGAGIGILSTDLAYYIYPRIKKLHLNNKVKQNLTLMPVYQYRTVGFNVVYKLN